MAEIKAKITLSPAMSAHPFSPQSIHNLLNLQLSDIINEIELVAEIDTSNHVFTCALYSPTCGIVNDSDTSFLLYLNTLKKLLSSRQQLIHDWIDTQFAGLQKTICTNTRLRQLCENDCTDEALVLELARQIITHTSAPENLALLLSAFLLKTGFSNYCSIFWQSDNK